MGPPSSTVKNPALSLAPLKKVPPPVAKVEGTKKEDLIKTAKPALEVRPMSKSIDNERSVVMFSESVHCIGTCQPILTRYCTDLTLMKDVNTRLKCNIVNFDIPNGFQ